MGSEQLRCLSAQPSAMSARRTSRTTEPAAGCSISMNRLSERGQPCPPESSPRNLRTRLSALLSANGAYLDTATNVSTRRWSAGLRPGCYSSKVQCAKFSFGKFSPVKVRRIPIRPLARLRNKVFFPGGPGGRPVLFLRAQDRLEIVKVTRASLARGGLPENVQGILRSPSAHAQLIKGVGNREISRRLILTPPQLLLRPHCFQLR